MESMALRNYERLRRLDNYFHIVVDHARDKWKEIGRRLGLTETDVSAINMEERGDTTEGCRKVLDKWRQMKGRDATVDELKQAFFDLERRDILDLFELEECFQQQKAAEQGVDERQQSAMPVRLYLDDGAPGESGPPLALSAAELSEVFSMILEEDLKSKGLTAQEATTPPERLIVRIYKETDKDDQLDIENIENTDFVGREKELLNLMDRIHTDGDDKYVKIIWINGFPGVGKTMFAHQLCLEQRRKKIFISLAKVTSVDNMLTLIMREFGVSEINEDGNTQVEATVAHLIGTHDGEDCSLILDDVARLLEAAESRRRFIGFLAKVQDKQNPKVHVIVTSRYSVISRPDLAMGDVPPLEATPVILNQLTDLDGTTLVRKLVGKGNITLEDAREVCKRCKGWPLAIRIVCGVIRKDRLHAAEMIKRLGKLTEIRDIRGFLTIVLSTLSRDLLATLKLVSVFVGPFTVESACIISGRPDQLFRVWTHLRELSTRGLLKAGSTDGAPRYDTHDVVRNFVSTLDSDVVTVQEMAAAQYRFQKLYEARLTEVAQNMQGNMQMALASYSKDVDNFNHFLSLIHVQEETQDDYEW
ncbi:uncharacterized protein LOC144864131 [Branchiostoma floridae x Branchiostoma japonicum]